MALLDQWKAVAYNEATGKEKLQQIWGAYFEEEKKLYAKLLKNPDVVEKGTVKELADKFGMSIMSMTGFLDGINDSLITPNPIDDMEEDTVVQLGFDKELLYKTWWLQKLTGCITLKSGMPSSMQTRRRLFTESRRHLPPLRRKLRFILTILALAEVVRSIRSAVEEMQFKLIICRA